MNGWKIFAIILLIVLILENIFLYWGYTLVQKDKINTNDCYYNFCKEYDDALYDPNTALCTCYSIDEKGEYKSEDNRVYN